jgi:uncharacterized protein YndB with AHSA1/START domain
MTSIHHELKISAPRTKIIEALTKGTHVERWHGAKVSDVAGTLRLEYPSGVEFQWRVVHTGPNRVTWQCVEGPGRSAGTEATFAITEAGDGRTAVAFEHSGWSDSDPQLRKCNTLWGFLLQQLQQHLAPTESRSARL